jgi:hypothetical protein
MSAPDPVSVLKAYAVDGLLTTEDDPGFWAAVLKYHWPMVEVSSLPAVKDASSALVLQGYDWSPSNSEADPYEDNPYLTPEENAEFRRRHEETVERWKHLPPWAYEAVRAASPYAVWLPKGQFSLTPPTEDALAEFADSFDGVRLRATWLLRFFCSWKSPAPVDKQRSLMMEMASMRSGGFHIGVTRSMTSVRSGSASSRPEPEDNRSWDLFLSPDGGLGRLDLIERPARHHLILPRPSRGMTEADVRTAEYVDPMSASAYVTSWCRQPDGAWAATETRLIGVA